MKKLLLLMMIPCLLLVGCTDDAPVRVRDGRPAMELVEFEPEGTLYVHYGYSTVPYYNKNGKLCRFVDGEIVEIEDD